MNEPLNHVYMCFLAIIVTHKGLTHCLKEGAALPGRCGYNEVPTKCTVREETRRTREWIAPLMCQNFSLSGFPNNVDCWSVWSFSHWDAWQFSSLRLAEALSIDCDVQWHTVSQACVCSKDSESLPFTDQHKAQQWYCLMILRTFIIEMMSWKRELLLTYIQTLNS